MKIRIIAEGAGEEQYRKKEWGLALLVGEDILFDTFYSGDSLRKAARESGIDLSGIKHVVLSHDHWDHTGGLEWILTGHRDVTVHVCTGSSGKLMQKLETYNVKVREITSPACIRAGVYTTGPVEGMYAGKKINEQALIFKQGERAAVLTGCAHPGIIRMLQAVRGSHSEKVSLILGGFHLRSATEEVLEEVAAALEADWGDAKIVPLHCSGENAVSFFRNRFPANLIAAGPGDVFKYNDLQACWDFLGLCR